MPMALVRTFEVGGGDSLTVNLVCAHFGANALDESAILNSNLALTFTALEN